MLKIEHVCKNFGGLQALQDVSLTANQNEILGLIGPNGSGKTTLFNCICGNYKVSSGTIHFGEKEIENLPSYKISRMGVGLAHQRVCTFFGLSVYENVYAGAAFSEKHRFSKSEMEDHVLEAIEFVGLSNSLHKDTHDLTLNERKRIEIARALVNDPSIILLDEVAAGLNHVESQAIIQLIHKIRDRGITILMVEHIMPIVMNVCHRVVVLAEGKKIAEGKPQEISKDPLVIESYLGEVAMKEVEEQNILV